MSEPERRPEAAGRGLSVLFIGGSGVISSACSWLAADRGIDLFILNRGLNRGRGRCPGGPR